MAGRRYAMGLDFGTGSVRALVVDVATGQELGSGVAPYASGDEGVLYGSDPNLARQNPADYGPAMDRAVRDAFASAWDEAGFDPSLLSGIGVDTTGSTPLPVDAALTPLTIRPEFAERLDACAWLWKDHTSHEEAERISGTCRKQGKPYLERCGGAYSSEWFWSKALRFASIAPDIAGETATWIELQDYIPALLTGDREPRRGVCAAGHKGLFAEEWGGFPEAGFLAGLHPRLADWRATLPDKTFSADHTAGTLRDDLARAWGVPLGTPVAVGIIDAHAGAVGSGVAEGRMIKVMGTSGCDMLVAPAGSDPRIPGVSGVVDGSILPGRVGIEGGQSAVGDLFAWWSSCCGVPQDELARQASALKPGESGLLALDWNNGNRNVLCDPRLSGLLIGQSLRTTAAEVYLALIEAWAFGALIIIRRIEESGVKVREIVAGGGVAGKSPLALQVLADVTGMPILRANSENPSALGAAIFGSVVGGAHDSVEGAVKAMAALREGSVAPRAQAVPLYRRLFGLYSNLHDAFGVPGSGVDVSGVMKELLLIRESASA